MGRNAQRRRGWKQREPRAPAVELVDTGRGLMTTEALTEELRQMWKRVVAEGGGDPEGAEVTYNGNVYGDEIVRREHVGPGRLPEGF